jgi:hypothetical protein
VRWAGIDITVNVEDFARLLFLTDIHDWNVSFDVISLEWDVIFVVRCHTVVDYRGWRTSIGFTPRLSPSRINIGAVEHWPIAICAVPTIGKRWDAL